MSESEFLKLILDDPDDEVTRQVFADWLDDNGQSAPAGWVRASCEYVRVRSSDPSFAEIVLRQRECWERCRPAWWEEIAGVFQNTDRGTFRFEIRSKTAAARLGKVKWLGDAVAGGWLAGIRITWSDGPLAEAVAKWKNPAREVPLFVRLTPQISDEGLAIYNAVPHLVGLYMPGRSARILHLPPRTDLRELELDWPQDDTDFSRVGQLTGLRRLEIQGRKRPRPTDQDLDCVRGLSGLRHLELWECEALTDACLSRLTGLQALRRLRLLDCRGISAEAIAALGCAMPAVQVERL